MARKAPPARRVLSQRLVPSIDGVLHRLDRAAPFAVLVETALFTALIALAMLLVLVIAYFALGPVGIQ